MKLTNRENQAFEILKTGGYFRHALETDRYTHREQFQTRLRNSHHQVIKGVGFATQTKFETLGLLRKVMETSSVWGTNYYLSSEVKFALILCGEI